MKKIIIGTAFLGTLLLSDDLAAKKVEEFIQTNSNSSVEKISIKKEVKLNSEWNAYLVSINLKGIQNSIEDIFILDKDNKYITQGMFDISTNQNLRDIAFEKLQPIFEKSYYNENNLVFGNSKSKNKLVVFTDPFCPACISFIGKDLIHNEKELLKNNVAVYFYSIPVVSNKLNETLIKISILNKLKNKTSTDFKMYQEIASNNFLSDINNKEDLINKFNKVFSTKYNLKDLEIKEVTDIYKNNLLIADKISLKGTPTVFYNDLFDMSKSKYLKGE